MHNEIVPLFAVLLSHPDIFIYGAKPRKSVVTDLSPLPDEGVGRLYKKERKEERTKTKRGTL
jgi:hypothetical protein